MTNRYNASLRRFAAALPVQEFRFARERVIAAGIPFLVSTSEQNVLAVDGEMGTVSVPVSLPSAPSEAYLLLAADFPRWEEPSHGDGRMWRVWHPHRFVVELRYADGTSEQIFPLHITTQRHEIVEGLDVYVVPVSKPLTELRVHDRMGLGEFGLCGVTFNMGKQRFDPKLWQAPSLPVAKKTPLRPATKPQVLQQGNAVVLENANLRVRIEAGAMTELRLLSVNRNVLVQPVPLFTVVSWDGKVPLSSAAYRWTGQRLDKDKAVLEYQPPDTAFPQVTLTATIDAHASLVFEVRLHNAGAQPQRWRFSFPARWNLRIGDGDVYTYPLRTAVISSAPNKFHYRYGGTLPLQFLDLSNPSLGVGVGMLTKDLLGLDRNMVLEREGEETVMGISWRCDPLPPNASASLPPVELIVHSGDWKATFERYKAWVKTWYRSLAPRKAWFRQVFAFRQDYLSEGLFDLSAKVYRFAERIALARQAFGACDFLHIFDWGATVQRGRVGDYDPWGEHLTTPDDFRNEVLATQARGVPVGLYIEGYLVDKRSRIGKVRQENWGLRDPDGTVQFWTGLEFVMCPGVQSWREWLTSVYKRVREETGAIGFYIDQFGFCHRDCFAAHHDHPPDWHVLRGEGLLTRQIREALPPECVVYTECFPPDIHTVLQDGSFDYTINSYQTLAHRWMPVPVRLGRFAFPDFKVLQIVVCDYPTGSNEEAVKQVFFNGDGYWLQGNPESWFTAEVLALLRHCLALLRQHADAFVSDDCEPFVPTLREGVFANRFAAPNKTVWTLYNANWRSVDGEVLAVPHVKGTRYFDAWNGKELKPRIVGGVAYLSVTIAPHSVGCIVQQQ